MIKKLSLSDCASAPWKNGLGMTTQLGICPVTAVFPRDSFEWRLSVARMQASGDFSLFPGYQRLLVVWDGRGIQLNQAVFRRDEVISFSGEKPMHANLLSDEPIADLGLIYDPKQVQAEMKTEVLTQGESSSLQLLKTGFLFCTQGSIEVDGEMLKREEGAFFSSEPPNDSVIIRALDDSRWVWIHLHSL